VDVVAGAADAAAADATAAVGTAATAEAAAGTRRFATDSHRSTGVES
jgi:hypothetical protein